MPKITIEIDMDNDAFSDEDGAWNHQRAAYALGSIFEEVRHALINEPAIGRNYQIRDEYGNYVGDWKVEET